MDIVRKYENFSRLSYEEKIKIKEEGRPLPDMSVEFQGSSRGKQYVRKFNRDIYLRNKWICGCAVKNAFFCFPCILFGGDIKWTRKGIHDLIHLRNRIKTHEYSKQHILNRMHLAVLGTTNIQAQLDSVYWTNIQKHNEQVTKNRYVLSNIIDSIQFSGAFELALREHETETPENAGISRGLINFTAELDTTLHEHLQKVSILKSTSKDIQNDLLSCMLDVYYEEITKEISAAQFIAVMADDTTDVLAKFQLVIVLRYLQEGVPVERFWGFLSPSGRTAEILTENVLSVIEPLVGPNKNKLIAQSYDGANIMSGKIGVHTKIKEKFPNAHFIHCYAHQLNLIMGQAASQNTQVRTFLANIQDIKAFFSISPQRVAILDKIIGQKIPKSASAPAIWNFKSRTVNVVFEHREEIIECMEEIQDTLTENSITVSKATSIKRMLEDKVFIFWLTFFHHIMPHVDILCNQLQKRKIDTIEVNNAVKLFEGNIAKIRTEKIDLIVNEAAHSSTELINAKRRRTEESYDNIKIAALEVCDVITTVAKDRFEFSGHLVAVSLLLPEKFNDYATKFPEDELNSTINAYPMLAKSRLKTELSIIYTRDEYKFITGATAFLKFLISNDLEDVFLEVKKLLEILITIPMTTSEAERCFSTLNRTKIFLRNTITQDRLTALAALSIEHKFITSIPNFNAKVINKFEVKKSSADFIFKK